MFGVESSTPADTNAAATAAAAAAGATASSTPPPAADADPAVPAGAIMAAAAPAAATAKSLLATSFRANALPALFTDGDETIPALFCATDDAFEGALMFTVNWDAVGII